MLSTSSKKDLKKPLNGLQRDQVKHLHSGCSTFIWFISSRSSSKLNGWQTIMGTCQVLFPQGAGKLPSCRAPSTCQGYMVVFQLMKQLSTSHGYREISQWFTGHGNHVVHYSWYDWSSRGRIFLNHASGYKCWVQTLDHFSNINYRMKGVVKKIWSTPQRPCKYMMKQDAEAMKFSLKCFEENNSFMHHGDKQLHVSFSK